MSSKSGRAHVRNIRQGVTVWYVMALVDRDRYTNEIIRRVRDPEQRLILGPPVPGEFTRRSLFYRYRTEAYGDDRASVTDSGFLISGGHRRVYNAHGVFVSRRTAERYAKLMRITPPTPDETYQLIRREEWDDMERRYGYADPDYPGCFGAGPDDEHE